ncbi:MAG: IS1182 family transposase [Spirochaetia bacterium]|nr:IS1182 family transposase [Spirochaetia bacterium]
MKRVKPSMKSQGMMFAEYFIDDRLPDDHEVYVFDALVDEHDLREIIDSYSSEGGKVYNPRDMAAILLYAYSKGITSSYRIAGEVCTNLAFIYLAGGNQISRRTLCQFRRRNASLLKKLFSSTVQNAIEVGLIDPDGLFAIDGSKFAADASKSKTKTKKEWVDRKAKIESSIDQFLDEIEVNDLAEEGLEEERSRKFKEAMQKIKDRREKKLSKPETRELNRVEKQVFEHEKIGRLLKLHPDLKDDENINLTDPESRLQKNGTGEFLQGYNGQIITSNQIIVSADLIQDENDQYALQPMVQKLEKELPENAQFKFLGDAGYNRGENLKWLDGKKNIDPYISMADRREDNKTDLEKATGNDAFQYDENEDRYICPTGEPLEFFRNRESKGKLYKDYRAAISTCQQCPGRHKCLNTAADLKAGAKIIADDGTLVFRKAMREKMALPESKIIYAERAVEPEPVFGHIKFNLGIRRFRMRGFSAVKGEFLLISAAVNLSKLVRFKQRLTIHTI